jgi:signal transduction histidine kinase
LGLINISGLLILAAGFTIISLAFVLATKMSKIKLLRIEVDKLKRSLEEMDEQAKLIVRTDIELNKAQEELDKKITSLYALHGLSRAISTTLDENQLFSRIQESHIEDLGFEKGLSFLWNDKEKKFYLVLNIGYSQEEIGLIISGLDKDFYLNLIQKGKPLSSISIDKPVNEKINKIMKVRFFVVAPILPKEGNHGFLFVGTESADALLTEGDEELITILANQIGQSLENARLFEETWQAQQDLENKVEQRTNELTVALEEIKAISKRKTDFVSAVSHELRTPLTSIKGYASILLSEKLGGLPQAVKERLDKINRHSDELAHLVNDLLDISRIESGRVTMKSEPCELKDMVTMVADLLSVQLKEKDIEFAIDIRKDIKLILGDRQQLERVFINLVSNAIKFTPIKGKIMINAYSKDGLVQIDVTDTGIGIPPEAQGAIFEEFYRVDNPINQKVKGTGLGLSLVKHIVEAHKGGIWVKSKIGEGSTFSFTIPKPP